MLIAISRQSAAHGFFAGLITGIVYFTGTLYWITRVMAVYGGLSETVAVLVNAALIAYLALFPAIFGLIVARLARADVRLLMWAPLVWVTTELGRTYLFSGFPWVLLGYSQVRVLPIAQLASVVGVYGVSALVAWVSAALALVAVSERASRPGAYLRLAGAVAGVTVTVIWGSVRISLNSLTLTGDAVRVGLTQGNVDQAEKWNEQHANEIFQRYLQMSRQSAAGGAQFVLWPESAMPSIFGDDLVGTEQVRALARSIGVPILVGTDQIERGPASKYFNSAVLVRADGSTGAVYSKMHLVPFGEYVPLRRVFFFASRLVEAVSDFSPGESAVLLPVGQHQASTAICYEIVYPNLVRQSVAAGSELLTTITNDAWFGPTSAPYQHFAQASMRAIENGRYLVRAANTGISGIVDPYGRVLAQTGIYEPAVVIGDARFIRSLTVYTRIGDLFAYLSVLATVALLVTHRPRRIR